MTSYLRHSGPMPFTGADICADLGIDPARFALTLDDMITVEACNSAKPVVLSIWRVSVGPSFDRESLHGGVAPASIGAPYELGGITYRDCSYEPQAHVVAALRARVIAKARNSEDDHLAGVIIDADAQRKVEAKNTLRRQLAASAVLEGVA